MHFADPDTLMAIELIDLAIDSATDDWGPLRWPIIDSWIEFAEKLLSL